MGEYISPETIEINEDGKSTIRKVCSFENSNLDPDLYSLVHDDNYILIFSKLEPNENIQINSPLFLYIGSKEECIDEIHRLGLMHTNS